MSDYRHMGDDLPSLMLNSKTINNKKFRQSVMDSFERIGLQSLRYNISNFDDFYRMYDGTLSKKELKLMMPQYEVINDLLNQAELPNEVVHHDIIGGVINTLAGKLSQMQDKFHVTDTGEVAESDFLEDKNNQIRESLKEIYETKVKLHFAKIGINPETQQQFSSQEEQQQYQQQIEQERRKVLSASKEKLMNTANFKTSGQIWAEATLEKDKEELDFHSQYQKLFVDFLLSGKFAKITKMSHGSYKPFIWDARTLFHSSETGKEFLNDFSYAGRVHFQTPEQILEEWGEYLSYKDQKSLIEGDETWKELSRYKYETGSVKEVLKNNFFKKKEVPYLGYDNMLFMRKIEELTGLPMGTQVDVDANGDIITRDSFIPYHKGSKGIERWLAEHIETRFPLTSNICQVTEVYFRAYEPIGYLTYEDEEGNIVRGEIVTEDIYSDFLKENNIKNIKTKSIDEFMEDDSFESNTIVWDLRPVVAWGVKICSPRKQDPIYLGVKKLDYQIPGQNDYDFKLPVTGFVGKSLARKLAPWQELYNYSWNSIKALAEKELGTFFLLGVENIPSEFAEHGDTQEAILELRNMAKTLGFMPVARNIDSIDGSGGFNQMTVHSVTHGAEIQNHMNIANVARNEMMLTVGLNPQEGLQATQHATAEGVKQSNEAMQTQIQHLYDTFNKFVKVDYNQHLAIAQFAQTMNMDRSLYYTKSDTSLAFLRINDPKLPLRRLGIIATDDSRRRKELEIIKQTLINRNTMDMDSLEFISLMTTDSWRELMKIAEEERTLKQEMAQAEHERRMSEIQQQGEEQRKADLEKWKLEEYSKSLDRRNKIEVEVIEATGRAADKQGNEEDFNQIESARKNALEATKQANDFEAKMRDIELRQEDLNRRANTEAERLLMEKEKMRLKEKEIDTKRYTSEINKN